MDEILRIVEGMQVSDAKKVAMPANWPNNEHLGSRVIIPPATDVEMAKERIERAKKGEFECIDWWLCHKEL
jgi:peroxiredoxin (alkyl hydroperoxide reductase subunit C)